MGSSEIDFELIVAGRRRGFEVKGWTVDTWREALDVAVRRARREVLTEAQLETVRKIDHMLGQLHNIRSATGAGPMLGVTDALPADLRTRLRDVLRRANITDVELVRLNEAQIKEHAAGTIGAAFGIPRP